WWRCCLVSAVLERLCQFQGRSVALHRVPCSRGRVVWNPGIRDKSRIGAHGDDRISAGAAPRGRVRSMVSARHAGWHRLARSGRVWVEPTELATSLVDGEVPRDGRPVQIALSLPGCELATGTIDVGEALGQALAGEHR